MTSFPLAPRYRLDDESVWLEGIDPARHYWLWVNGDRSLSVALPGLSITSLEEFVQAIRCFRSLGPGEQTLLHGAIGTLTLHCISSNCYAIAAEVQGAPLWHLFDQEALESLLMTAHLDWQCSEADLALGRRLLARAWQQPTAAEPVESPTQASP